MDLLVQYALTFCGLPYRWGGDDPIQGFDCSGLVQEILASAGLDPKGDQTAQGLYDYFEKRGSWGIQQAGSLVFYGKDAFHISHVGFMIDSYRMVEAGGGGSKTNTENDAARQNAYVRVRPIRNRADIVAIIKPYYFGIGAR